MRNHHLIKTLIDQAFPRFIGGRKGLYKLSGENIPGAIVIT